MRNAAKLGFKFIGLQAFGGNEHRHDESLPEMRADSMYVGYHVWGKMGYGMYEDGMKKGGTRMGYFD